MIKTAIQWVLSLIFNVQMYVMMALMALFFVPLAVIDRKWAFRAVRTYTNWVIWSARVIVGLKVEVRGTPPSQEALVAAKHQSFFDIIVIANAVPRPRFVMKSILRFAPILGYIGLRIGCVPVDRGRKGRAIEQMVAGVLNNPAGPGQLIIYPQGTRVPPGEKRPYKVGPAILYGKLDQPCYPVATNIGLFWPKRGIMRQRGTCVVDFLPPIQPGLEQTAFMQRLESDVETTSDALTLEARQT